MSAGVVEQWISTHELTNIIGLTQGAISKRINAGYYENIRYIDGIGRAGKVVQINLSCLPTSVQLAYKIQQSVEPEATKPKQEDYHKASFSERSIALNRLAVLRDYNDSLSKWQGAKKTEVLRGILIKYKISRATLYKWDKDYRERGLDGLLPSENLLAKRGSYKLDGKAYDYLLALYLSPMKRTVAHCYRLLEAEVIKQQWNIKMPSMRTVQRIIAELPEAVKMAGRETKKTVYDNCLPYTQRDMSKVLANQCWVGDHFRGDFFVKHKGKWIRPWLTAWLDMRSRKFVSWMLCETPSTGTIISSFAKAALDHNIGLPMEVYLDNGRDYCSKEFAGQGHRTRKTNLEEKPVATMLESLNVGVTFAIPENARAKVIEREFRVLAEEICKEFPTWCASKPKDRPEDLQKLLKKDAPCINITLDEASVIIGDWIKNVKNKRRSDGAGRQGEYPDETFEKYRMAYRAAPTKMLKMLLTRHSQPLTVRMAEVKFKGYRYYHEALIKRYGEKVYIRYNEDAMDKVTVWDLDDRYICEAYTSQALPALGVDKEVLAIEQKRKGKARKMLYEDELLQIARGTKTSNITEVLEIHKELAKETIAAKRPDVLLPIAMGQNIVQAAPIRKKYDVINILKTM